MNSRTCNLVVIVSWLSGVLFQISGQFMPHFSFPTANQMQDNFSDQQLLKLSCDNTLFMEFILLNGCFCSLFFDLTIVSYTCITHHPFKILVSSGRRKAFFYVCLPLHLCCDWLRQLLVPLRETQANAGHGLRNSSCFPDGFRSHLFSSTLSSSLSGITKS